MQTFEIIETNNITGECDIVNSADGKIATNVHWLYARRIVDILNTEAKCSQCKQLANSLKNVSDSFVAQVEYTTEVLRENKRIESYIKKPNN